MPTTLAPDAVDAPLATAHPYFMYAGEHATGTSKTPIATEYIPWLFDTGTALFAAKIDLPVSNDFSFARKLLDHAARILPCDEEADQLVDNMLAESIRGRKATKRSRV